jgi:hypothetical protein
MGNDEDAPKLQKRWEECQIENGLLATMWKIKAGRRCTAGAGSEAAASKKS